MHVCVCVHYFI
uniref:Uncharacterized protein n=1 Tax=Anguilla anguilla TaxID=7936 RepID=A0A0E9UWB0_ANGAN